MKRGRDPIKPLPPHWKLDGNVKCCSVCGYPLPKLLSVGHSTQRSRSIWVRHTSLVRRPRTPAKPLSAFVRESHEEQVRLCPLLRFVVAGQPRRDRSPATHTHGQLRFVSFSNVNRKQDCLRKSEQSVVHIRPTPCSYIGCNLPDRCRPPQNREAVSSIGENRSA